MKAALLRRLAGLVTGADACRPPPRSGAGCQRPLAVAASSAPANVARSYLLVNTLVDTAQPSHPRPLCAVSLLLTDTNPRHEFRRLQARCPAIPMTSTGRCAAVAMQFEKVEIRVTFATPLMPAALSRCHFCLRIAVVSVFETIPAARAYFLFPISSVPRRGSGSNSRLLH
eukprot:4751350-Pleurochrysis_carterae.AAC.1